MPLSPAARAVLERQPDLLARVLTGGDDYELLFGVDPAREADVVALSERLDLPLSRIGRVAAARSAGPGAVRVLKDGGRPLVLESRGWTHF